VFLAQSVAALADEEFSYPQFDSGSRHFYFLVIEVIGSLRRLIDGNRVPGMSGAIFRVI